MNYKQINIAIDGYPVIVEASPDNYGAYSPDLPGCAVGADTYEEVVEAMREIIPFHLEGLARRGLPIPPPHPDLLGQSKSLVSPLIEVE